MEGPLKGYTIVEVSFWAAVPASGALLGDWGADVIKIEPIDGGDPVRALTIGDMDADSEVRPPFELDNRNKRSVAVDLRNPAGYEFALRIIERADVFVTSFRLDALERLKLTYPILSARNPRLVYASFNGYGHRGADRLRPGYDYAAGWARTGLMATAAEPGEPPPAQRPAMIDQPSGLALAGAISAALLGRARTGRGCEVQMSLFAMGLWMNSLDLTIAMMGGGPAEPQSRADRPNPLWNAYRCKDGRWLYFVLIQPDRHWEPFCAALERREWIDDERFRTSQLRTRNNRDLIRLIEETLNVRTLAEWAPRLDEYDLVWAPVQSNADVLSDPQAHALGIFHAVDHPRIKDCRVVRGPVEFGGFEDQPFAPAPRLGQHTESVALEAGLSREEIARLREAKAIG